MKGEGWLHVWGNLRGPQDQVWSPSLGIQSFPPSGWELFSDPPLGLLAHPWWVHFTLFFLLVNLLIILFAAATLRQASTDTEELPGTASPTSLIPATR